MPENTHTLKLPLFLTFRVFFPIPFAGIPFEPFQFKDSLGTILPQNINFLRGHRAVSAGHAPLAPNPLWTTPQT